VAVGFYYRISPNDNTFATQGSETFGTRLTGRVEVPGAEGLAAFYRASYAYQRDAGRNQLDVDTHYLMGEVGLEAKKLGQIAIGYEELGSDQGAAVLATPFATAHKFNEYLSFLYKFAHFDGGKNRSPLNTTRSILQTTFKF